MTRREEAMHDAREVLAKHLGIGAKKGSYHCPDIAHAVITAYEAHMRPEVTHLSELLDLPVGTILRDLDGDAWVKDADEEGLTWWVVSGSEDGFNGRGIMRPARVIHWGADS